MKTLCRRLLYLLGPLVLGGYVATAQSDQGPTKPHQTATRWEMRVCTDPNNFPASSRQRPGFENRVAALLAEQLQARLSFVWAYRGDDLIKQHLRTGECDLVMGVADGTLGVLSTIVYYQSPYVFVYPQAAPFELSSLDDPKLRDLRIGTYPFSIPYTALLNLGLKDRVVLQHAVGGPGGPNFDRPLLESLERGQVDVTIIYGPVAGYFASQHPGRWRVVPVTPKFVPPSLQLVRQWTIAVRPGDAALRDRLNVALVERWDDLQEVFEAFGVPLDALPKPILSVATDQ